MLYPILKQNKKILKVHVFSPSVPPENNTKSVSEVQGTSTKIQRYICMYRDVCPFIRLFTFCSYTVYIYIFSGLSQTKAGIDTV